MSATVERRLGLLGFAACVAASPGNARADVDDWFTLGLGAQYGYVASGSEDATEAPERQFGFVSRLKVLKFLGAEVTTSFDQDPGTQRERILSPRYQIGAMLNLVPTEYFNLFAVAGTGAQRAGDLFSVQGASTSLHFGPGLEVFVSDHVAVGGDVRWRLPGPAYIKDEVETQIESQADALGREAPEGGTPAIEADVGPRLWQANFTVSVYL
jgi:hypothetical protein